MGKEIRLPNKEIVSLAKKIAKLLTEEELSWFLDRSGSAGKDFVAQVLDLYGNHYLSSTIGNLKHLIAEFLYTSKDGLENPDPDGGGLFLKDLGVLFTKNPPEPHFVRTLRMGVANAPWHVKLLANLIFSLMPKERPKAKKNKG